MAVGYLFVTYGMEWRHILAAFIRLFACTITTSKLRLRFFALWSESSVVVFTHCVLTKPSMPCPQLALINALSWLLHAHPWDLSLYLPTQGSDLRSTSIVGTNGNVRRPDRPSKRPGRGLGTPRKVQLPGRICAPAVRHDVAHQRHLRRRDRDSAPPSLAVGLLWC